MKLCTYNLRQGGHKNHGNHWLRMLEELGADIVCAQESGDPSLYFTPEVFAGFKGCLHANVPHGKWGSAILAKHYALERIDMPGFEGWVTGAKIKDVDVGGALRAITVFSLHAPSLGSYEAQVNRFLDELGHHLDGTPLVLAGDFNLTTAVRHPSEEGLQNTRGELRILDRLRREFGLLNAWQLLNPNQSLPQTLRWAPSPTTPYHCDGIFVSDDLVRYLVRAEVIQGGEYASLSDHNPIVIEMR